MPQLIPAIVTPFNSDGGIDFASVPKLVTYFEDKGCDGIVVAGTNGEGPSLSATEKRDLSRLCVDVRGCKCFKVILCLSTNSLNEALWLVKQARKIGVDQVLLMTPSYFKEASQEGIEAWLRQVIVNSEVPILLYNYPQRTSFALDPGMIGRLTKLEMFAGIKDSSGDLANLKSYREVTGSQHSLYLGDERCLDEADKAGWSGTISGAANSVPTWMRMILNNGFDQVKFDLIRDTLKLIRSYPQPWGHKVILRELGVLPNADMRLPLQPGNTDDEIKIVSSILGKGFC